jgi:drug/metabolite transporter (DMT)-like permease
MRSVSKGRAYALLIVTIFFWGFSFISIKEVLAYLPPMMQAFCRFFVAVLLLLGMMAIKGGWERIARKDALRVCVAGISGVTLYFYMENNGVLLSTPNECSIIIATIPVIALLVNVAITRKLPKARHAVGVLLSMGGVWLIVSSGFKASGNFAGYLYMLGAAASWVTYVYVTKGLFARYSRLTIVFYQSLVGLIAFIPFAAMELPRARMPSPGAFGHLAFLGVCCSALGYYFYAAALERLGERVATVFVNLIPVVTVSAGLILGSPPLAAEQYAGAAVVMAGVFLATL